jgi:uncharacterized membrane protein
MRWILAAFYGAAGIAHLLVPEKLLAITPSWFCSHLRSSSSPDSANSRAPIALVTTPLRRSAGFVLAAYAICVWPANFKHAIDGVDLPVVANSWLYHGRRLLFQPVLVWWALYCADIIDWPWRRRIKG